MPDPNDPTYLYPWLTQGRTQPASQPRYYLPTITRPAWVGYRQQSQPQRVAGERWSQIPTTQNVSPNPFATTAAPPVYAPVSQAPSFGAQTQAVGHAFQGAGEQAQAPHGIVQIYDWARNQLAQAQAMGQVAQEVGRQYAPPETTTTTTGGGGGAGPGGGGGGQRTAPPPAGVDAYWYAEFQRQHNGQTPEQYYARTGENLAHAMADEEWARGFAEMYGRPPTDDDWRAHWFSSRVGYTPEEYERWKMRQIAQQVIQESRRQEQKEETEEETPEQRAPVYQPPFITWR